KRRGFSFSFSANRLALVSASLPVPPPPKWRALRDSGIVAPALCRPSQAGYSLHRLDGRPEGTPIASCAQPHHRRATPRRPSALGGAALEARPPRSPPLFT